jgi:hypothetical protein
VFAAFHHIAQKDLIPYWDHASFFAT